MNLTNPLQDIVPAKYRQQVYAALMLGAIVFSIFQASDGDWSQFVAGLFAALVGATATSNTNVEPKRRRRVR